MYPKDCFPVGTVLLQHPLKPGPDFDSVASEHVGHPQRFQGYSYGRGLGRKGHNPVEHCQALRRAF